MSGTNEQEFRRKDADIADTEKPTKGLLAICDLGSSFQDEHNS